MSKKKHTPLPWNSRKSPLQPNSYRCVYFSTNREEPYSTGALEPADAEFIVRAVNAHYQLVDALEKLLAEYRRQMNDDYGVAVENQFTEQAVAALEKAGSEVT